jgi:hypothetical protein
MSVEPNTIEEDLVPIRANGRVFHYAGRTYEPGPDDIVRLPRAALPDVRDYAFSLRPEISKLAADRQSHFGGLLIRWYADNWSWCDGVHEPIVRDLKLKDLYPGVVNKGYQVAEVPVAMASFYPELRWIINGDFEEAASSSDYRFSVENPGPFERRIVASEPRPRVYLVQLDKWEEQNRTTCLGAIWPADQTSRIIERAKLLGWEEGR